MRTYSSSQLMPVFSLQIFMFHVLFIFYRAGATKKLQKLQQNSWRIFNNIWLLLRSNNYTRYLYKARTRMYVLIHCVQQSCLCTTLLASPWKCSHVQKIWVCVSHVLTTCDTKHRGERWWCAIAIGQPYRGKPHYYSFLGMSAIPSDVKRLWSPYIGMIPLFCQAAFYWGGPLHTR